MRRPVPPSPESPRHRILRVATCAGFALAACSIFPASGQERAGTAAQKEGAAPAAAPAAPEASAAYCLLLEPRFMRHEHGKPVEDAQKTDLVPGRVTEWGPEVIRPDEFERLGLAWDAFVKQATANASREFRRLAPAIRIFKDEDGTDAFALLESDDATAAAAIFAPEFRKHFEKNFGDRLFLAVPSRTTVFVFPRGTDAFRKLGEDIIARYFDATYPCSLELLELDKTGLRAVGTFLDE